MAIDCEPKDERYHRQYETYQHQAISAILERSTLDRFCFLTRLTQIPDAPSPEELAFAVKGLLRCNFRKAADGPAWRRLFGTTKKRWHKEEWKPLPLSWRSRVLFQTFANRETAQNFLQCCPFKSWSAANVCPHLSALNQPSANNSCVSYVLLQVEDVALNGTEKFSDLLRKFLKSTESDFSYVHDSCCPSLSGAVLPASLFPSTQTTRIVWELKPVTLLHTGVSLDFAKAFFGQQREPHSRNLRLSHPTLPGQLTPALLVSSLKGVLRSALAWLLEKIAWQQGWANIQNPCTSDYRQGKEEDFNQKCPVRALLGGPLPAPISVAGASAKVERAAAKGLITFSAGPGSYVTGTARANWQTPQARFRFARRLLEEKRYQEKRDRKDQALLHIETIDINSPHLITEISPGPHGHAALLALCLAADLVSAGCFRLGRFTSRGFGIVRLYPRKVEQGTLVDFLEKKQQTRDFGGNLSGFKLAEEMGFLEPLSQLAAWLQNFAASATKGEP